MASKVKGSYVTETTYAYTHANPYHEYPSWRPRMLRPPGITLLLFSILVVLGLLEGAIRKLPHKVDSRLASLLNESVAVIEAEHFVKRQTSGSMPSSGLSDDPISGSVPSIGSGEQQIGEVDDGSSSSSSTPTSAAPGTDFEAGEGTFTQTPDAPPPPPATDFVDEDGGTVTQSAPDSLTPSVPASDFVNQPGFLTQGPPVGAPAGTSAPAPTDFVADASNAAEGGVAWTASSTDPTTKTITGAGGALTSDYVGANDPYITHTISTGDAPISDFVGANDPYTSQMIGGRPSGSGSAIADSGTRETTTQTLTFTAIANWQNPWYNPSILPPQKDTGPVTVYVSRVIWPRWAGFLGSGAFAVAVLAGLNGLWSIFYSQIILIEPFANMTKPNGARAKDALFSQYASQSLFVGPLKGIRSQRWLYFLASLAAILSALCASLASEVLLTDTHGCDTSPPGYNPLGKNPCPPQLMVDFQATRALQAVLSLIALIVLILGVLLHLRKTHGVSSDPSSVAMVASLVHHPGTVAILRSIPPDASAREMKRIIGPRRFKLSAYEATDGTWKYGIIPVEDILPIEPPLTSGSAKWHESKWFTWLHDGLLGAILLGLLGVVAAYFKITDQENKFNMFFNGQSFGARFILTGAGSIVAALWHNIYSEVDMKCIFAQLARGHAHASSTVLATRSSTSATSIFPSLVKGQIFAAIVAIADIPALVLVIALSGVPYRSGAMQVEYVICSYVAMATSGLLFVVLLLTAVWRLRLPKWPRQPDSLAALMSYLVDSDLTTHFERANECDQTGSNAIATIKGRKWAFDRCLGPDDIVRWTVLEDKEPLMITNFT